MVMSDVQSGTVARADELLKALMPGESDQRGDAELRARLSELVIAPEEVLLLPISPVASEPSGSTEGADLQRRLKQEIAVALSSIDDPAVKEIAQTILVEIKAVFSRLSLVESNLRKLDTLQENLSILEMLHFDTHSLVQYVEANAMPTEGVSEKLYDVLDGMSYGITHDVKRIFEQGILGTIANQTTPVVYGKILHAHGLLTNCFQQSVITLLQVFNPSLDPLLLFDDFEQRLRQSLSLCRDLSSVMRVVHNAQLEPSPDNMRAVVNSVMDFRDGSMQYLMYRDWRGYERLALELITAIEHNRETKDLLHQFACYLDVLYGHVKMRAVLRDMFASSSEEVQL
jgi:hypothetical protein